MDGNTGKHLFQLSLGKAVCFPQFLEKFIIFCLVQIDLLSVFDEIGRLRTGGLRIGVGDKKKEADNQENNEVVK